MANVNLLTFVLAALGGFIGALIGSSFARTSYPPLTELAAAKAVAPGAALVLTAEAPLSLSAASAEPECPPAPPCPPCEEQQTTRPDDAPAPDSASLAPALPATPGSYDVRNFYPLHHAQNRFEVWYDAHRTGKGVWKWTQYFPAWERHLAKFVAKSWAGEEVHMAELGIFSGGSLEMWQAVFGPGLRLWGCDIATVTKQYENDDKSGRTKIFNMDQTSANAWTEFKKLVPKLDILLDDGLHLFSGQKATFDNIIDHIAPGGVFMTEDISDGARPGARRFDGEGYKEKYLDYSFAKTRDIHVEKTYTQAHIDSIHYYPYLFVVEKRERVLRPHGADRPLEAIKHGTLWKPITHGVVNGQHATNP